ncbi:MAG: hypothetical protein PsegKO_22920 [Pseudohongiellaceae bacterium]
MNKTLPVTLALLRKDLLGLLPLVLMAQVTFLIVPLVASLDLPSIRGDQSFWVFLQANIYWIGFALGLLLLISVIQQDPAESLHHDWLTRPITRRQWLLGKTLFMTLTFLLPVLIARIVIHLSEGMLPALAIRYAAGIQEMEAAILLPLLLMAALLAPNLRKLILLMVGVFFVFLLPGWSATRPILAVIGIELGGDFDSLMWVQGVILVAAGLLGAGCIYWLLYCRRQVRLAYVAFWCAVAVMFLAVYPPGWLYDWDRAIALNAALMNSDNADLEEQVILDKAMACFPAAFNGDPNATEQQNQLIAQANWLPEASNRFAPGAMTFATPIRYREILAEWFSPGAGSRDHSVPWRLDRIRTQARFTADSLAHDVPVLRSGTAENRFDPISATETDYWLVSADKLAALAADPSAQLVMEFDASLLAPRSYELPVDGERHNFPELGSCKAELDSSNNQIDIECLKRGVQPELISAQFIGMDSSRVDNYSRGVYTPDWVEAFKRQRHELSLNKPSLTNTTTVMITAFEARRILRKELVFPGILGDSQSICPLPDASNVDIERASSWSDRSSHEVSYISVQPGVRLEVLDWRREIISEAPTLVLLPGLGATAHSYDELAQKLAEQYNVVAITRRGTGDSGKPDRGYGIARLSQDVLQVLDALELRSVILVGHSFGGEELSYLGANHAERVAGLVYLDAAYDRVSVNADDTLKRSRALSMQLPDEPPIRPAEAVSYEALADYMVRTGRGNNVPEGEIIASYDLSTGGIKHDELYLDALMGGIQAPDYERIAVPALALYAVSSSPAAFMEAWYEQDDPRIQQIVHELHQMDRNRKLPEVERFRSQVPHSRAVILEDADHWIFLSHESEVLAEIRRFLDSSSIPTR